MGAAFADYDDDGFTDIFVANDGMQQYLFHNNGDGTFTESALNAGAALRIRFFDGPANMKVFLLQPCDKAITEISDRRIYQNKFHIDFYRTGGTFDLAAGRVPGFFLG